MTATPATQPEPTPEQAEVIKAAEWASENITASCKVPTPEVILHRHPNLTPAGAKQAETAARLSIHFQKNLFRTIPVADLILHNPFGVPSLSPVWDPPRPRHARKAKLTTPETAPAP